ncbi:MAG: DUF2203 domain-containing protein [Chloroflexi bacterium]|nr:DUF2203 domain-containing protein [Chloroflexota bacterium]
MAKIFTVEEADRLLSTLRELLADIQRDQRELEKLHSEWVVFQRRVRSNGHGEDPEIGQARSRWQAAAQRVEASIRKVSDLGCELKDVELGLVDFPSWRDGRQVYLCWRLGEERVAYWHGLEAGYAGRQPL